MSDESASTASLAETSRARAREALSARDTAIEEIERRYGLMLNVRECKIRQLEEKLAEAARQFEDKLAETVKQLDEQHAEAEKVLRVRMADSQSDSRLDVTVLLVEPGSILRDALMSALERRYHVFSAADGWEALRLMVDRPDLMLTELDLPRVGLTDLVRYAGAITPNTTVLGMCDADAATLLSEAQASGVTECLVRPFSVSDVVAKVESLAAIRERQPLKSVLTVCPDPKERDSLCHLLGTRYRACAAGSPTAAMEAAGTPFDVLVLDAAGGDYAWSEVAAFFRERHANIKILVLAEADDEMLPAEAGRIGIDAVISKPYRFDELLARLRRILGVKDIHPDILRTVYRRLA